MMGWALSIFGPAWWVIMPAGMVTYFAISVYLAYRVHKDVVQRGIPSPEFWMVFVLLLNVVGYLLYLLVRKNYASSPKTEERA